MKHPVCIIVTVVLNVSMLFHFFGFTFFYIEILHWNLLYFFDAWAFYFMCNNCDKVVEGKVDEFVKYWTKYTARSPPRQHSV